MTHITRLILLLLLLTATQTTQAFYNRYSALGTNTNEISDDDSSVPFIDLMKMALPFREARQLNKGVIEYDRYGWPIRISAGGQAGTRFVSKLPAGTIPSGAYTVLYEGQGTLAYGNDATLLEQTPGREIILLEPGSDNELNATLFIKATNPANPIRNIRILPPGGICASNPFQRVATSGQCKNGDYLSFEQQSSKIIFNPDYLHYMKDFRVIRFMNMSGITRNPMYAWEDRASIDQQTWAGVEGIRGAPMEVMVELANRLHADPWFSLPHAATDDFILRFAEYVHTHLDPTLKVYVEYTNEAWNGIFNQHAYVKQQGLRLGLDADPNRAAWKYYSQRSVEIFALWERVFKGNQRVVRVMSGLTGNPDMTKTMLLHNSAYRYTDAFAIAPYVYGDLDALRKARNVNDVFRIMTDPKYPRSLPNVLQAIQRQAEVTRSFAVDLIAYEGGQHLVDMNTKNDEQHPNPLFYAANRHPQMGAIYRELLQGWQQAGGKLFVHFSSPRLYRKFGSFGTKEYVTQPDSQAPKHQAMLDFLRRNQCWWQGCSGDVFVRQTKPVATLETMKVQSDPLDKTAPKYGITTSESAEAVLVAMRQGTVLTTGQAMIRQVRNPQTKWQGVPAYQLCTVVNGQIDGARDLAAWWQAAWDTQHFYLRVAVEDDTPFVQDSAEAWEDDALELYLDADASRHSQYDQYNDFHFIFDLKNGKVQMGKNSPQGARLPISQSITRMGKGYVLDIALPWQALKVNPVAGHRLGLDIHITDDDDGNQRDGKLTWQAQQDDAWQNPALFGSAVLE